MAYEVDGRDCAFKLVATSRFSIRELAAIYNAGRADYIVPMQTDAEQLRDYIHMYDVDLDASVVILDNEDRPAGVGMLGIRGDRGWITRLGIIPERRQGGMGMCMMQALIDAAKERHARLIQLEVIEGNDAAHRLFLRCGFKEVRRLMVIQRPSIPLPDNTSADAKIERLSKDDIWDCLGQRDSGESWVNDNRSLANIEPLEGLRVRLGSGDNGWVIFQRKKLELSHVIWQVKLPAKDHVLSALFYHLHHMYPEYHAKIENVPVNDDSWETLQQFNYDEQFRRIEMFLRLQSL